MMVPFLLKFSPTNFHTFSSKLSKLTRTQTADTYYKPEKPILCEASHLERVEFHLETFKSCVDSKFDI